MKKFENVLVVSHIAYRKTEPLAPIEGPYSSLSSALIKNIKNVDILGLPLEGYKNEIIYGKWKKPQKKTLPSFLGNSLPVKFVIDILITTQFILQWSLKNKHKKKLVIGVDPLSCLPLLLFRPLLGYTLVFHCVDFNKNRFENKYLQLLYETADKWSSKYSDQTWVICEALRDYKRKTYGIESFYVPNSVVFNPTIYSSGHRERKGDKMIWTGSLLTDRQFDILFGFLSTIQKEIRKDIKYVIVPTKDHEKFELYSKKYMLRNTDILRLNGRLEFQKVAAKCDVGIALYDEKFGSTEFIEPMKIWDFLLCGLPFIVSKEPSLSKPILNSGVVYRLAPKNNLTDFDSLRLFLSEDNLASQSRTCLNIAKQFDIDKQVNERLKMLLLAGED